MLSVITEFCFCHAFPRSPYFRLYKQLGKLGSRKWRKLLLSQENMLFLLTTRTRCLELPEYWVHLCTPFLPVSKLKSFWSKVILGIFFAYSLMALFIYPALAHFYILYSLHAVCITHEPCLSCSLLSMCAPYALQMYSISAKCALLL